jgi:RNA polymerase sigma-70 factor (ECF subfamily)
MDGNEQHIIDGLRRGDNKAYRYLYDKYYVILCKIAFIYLRDDFTAQTLVDDLIFYLYEKRETLLINISLKAYLIHATKNRCLNLLKSETQQKEWSFSSIDYNDLLSGTPSDDYPLNNLLESELEEKVRTAIGKLPAECKTPFLKSRRDNKSYEEIASDMNISVNTVKYHIKHALALLRIDLGKYLILLLVLFNC